ncbi:MAG: four helix bundle protein [Patescibacteria group bacterium]|nr:four helix bundle protein [Patescibacteria group bacterium]
MKAWQEADVLALEIYIRLKLNKDFSYKDQIQRAAVSIMNNIAEGFERSSNRAFINHLLIAKGSCGEVRSMLKLGLQLGYFVDADYQSMLLRSTTISKMLQGLVNGLVDEKTK